MGAGIGAAGTGTAAGYTDVVNIHIEKQHFSSLRFGDAHIKNRVQTPPLGITMHYQPLHFFFQLTEHILFKAFNMMPLLLVVGHSQFQCLGKSYNSINIFCAGTHIALLSPTMDKGRNLRILADI